MWKVRTSRGGGGVKHLLHHSLIYSVEKMYIPKTVISYAINSQKINIILVKTRTVLHINKHSTSTNDHGKFGNIWNTANMGQSSIGLLAINISTCIHDYLKVDVRHCIYILICLKQIFFPLHYKDLSAYKKTQAVFDRIMPGFRGNRGEGLSKRTPAPHPWKIIEFT